MPPEGGAAGRRRRTASLAERTARPGPAGVSAGLTLALTLALGGCGSDPARFGITGPGTGGTDIPSMASEPTDDRIIPDPGLPTGLGYRYAPSVVPTTGRDGRYFGSD